MFEALLEKILLSHFGSFLSGLDRNNIHLGVWSGNLIIENVGLKPEVIEMLELPLQLRFSHIEKFQVNVPWSKINNQSVEIFIQNLFILVTHKGKSDWRPSNYKYELLEKFLRKLIEEFLQSKSKVLSAKEPIQSNNIPISVDKQGIFDRLITKITDNIQILIQNIHIRYENDLEKPGFSWGITLSELRISTTDANYKNRLFYDRSDMKLKDLPLYKKAELVKLGLYWNSNDLQFLSSLGPNDIKGKMYNFSLYEHEEADQLKSYSKRIDYIVSINSELKAVFNTNNTPNDPEVQFILNLKTLNFNIRNSQLKDFIHMIESFQNYQFIYQREKAKTRKKVNRPIKCTGKQGIMEYWKFLGNMVILNRMKDDFIVLLLRVLRWKKGLVLNLSEQKDLRRVFDKKEAGAFNRIVSGMEIEELYRWTKETFLREEYGKLYRKQKKLATGIFCGRAKNIKKQLNSEVLFPDTFGNKVKNKNKGKSLTKIETDNNRIESNEITINKGLDENIFKSNPKSRKINLPNPNPIIMEIPQQNNIQEEDFLIQSLFKRNFNRNITFTPAENSQKFYSFQFELEELNIRLTKRLKKYDEGLIFRLKFLQFSLITKSSSLEVKSQIRELGVDLINNFEAKNEIIIPILKKNEDFQRKKHCFLSFQLQKSLNILSLEMEIGAIEIIYYPSIMLKLMAYFNVQSSEEGVKNLAFEEYQRLQKQASNSFECTGKKSLEVAIRIKIASPSLIIPFLQYNDLQSPCFVLDLGDIELHNEDNTNFFQKKEEYQHFLLNFSAIQLFFYSSITYFYMIKKYGEISDFPDFLNSGNVKNEQFQIIENMKLKSRIQKLKVSNKDRPTAKVFIEFENVSINCSPKTFSDLLNFKKYFDNPDFRTQELLQTEMKSLFENAYRKGMLKKKESTFKNWSNYYAVFSGGYLYFFFSQKDLKYSSYLYIKDSIVKECSNEIGIPFSFKISSKLNDTFLACGSQNDLKLWVKILQKKIHEFSFKGHQFSVQNNRKSEINTKPNDINQINLYLTAHIISIQLNFLDYSLQKSMQASFSNISIRFTQRLLDFELLLSMESILFQDFLEKYAYPEIGTLLSSKDKEFLEVTVKSLEKNNPLYRNTDFEVILRISDLDIHWKAKTIVLLMKFLLEEPEFNIEILNEIANSNNVSPKQFNSSPQAHKEIKGLRDFAKKLTAKREELLEDENPFDLSQTFNQENNLILSINISLKGFELHMLPKNVSLAILEIPKFEGVFLMKAETMQIKMKIWGLQIREMTNYPETKIRFCKKENSIKLLNDDNSIEIQYISFDNNSKLMKNNISSKITIEINKLQLLWLQQPIFRINDYLNEEIIGPLTFDYKTPTLIKEDIRYMISLLKKPRFSLMSLSLIDTSLILKGNPKDFESLLLTIEEIDIKSFQEKTKNRIERVIPTELHNIFIKGKEGNLNWNEGVWQECYAISLNGCQLSYRANQRDKVYYITNNTKPLVGSLVIEKLFMGEECSKILQEEGGFYSVDKTMRVLSAFEPLDLRFQYESYQYLMRVLMNNLSYDDKKDMVFSNKGLEVLKEPKNPIQFIMDFSPLRLLLENFNPNIEKQYNLSGLPFAELSFISNRLIYERDLLSNTKIRLFFLDFRAESFEYLDDNHEGYKVFITGFLRALFQKSLSLPLFLKQRRIRAPTEKEINNDELPYNKDNLVSKLRTRKYYTNQARFSLEVLTGVERTLSFSIHNFLFLLNAGFLTNLLSYMSPKEEPTLNPSLKTTEDKPKKMTIDLTIRNALFCLQTSGDNEENILALQALIQIKYIKNHCNPSCTLHTSFHQDYKNSDSRLFNPYFRDFTSSFLLISLTKLELFNCNKEDLLAKTEDSDIWMLEIRKRALLQPSSLKYESEECLCHCVKSLQTQLKDSKLILGPTRVNFSFKDLFLINETSDWQKKELEKARKSENKGLFRKKSYEGLEEEDLKEDFEEEEEDLYINSEEGIKIPLERGEKIDIDRRSGLNMKSDKIEMILIDDIGKTLIPVVQMCCLLKSLQQESIETKQMYKGEFDLSLFYYNPSSGKLEPILENTSLILCYLANPLSNPKIYLTFELQPLLNPKTSLNLIFSEEMISGLLKTYWSLEREQLLFKKPELQTREIQKNLPYEGKFLRKNTTSKKYYRDYMKYVSIYSISNETGYDLELLRDEAKLQISLNFQRSYITGLSSRNPLDERLNARTLVRNGETENFEVHSDETNFEKTFHKSHTISIVFRAVSGQEIEIPNIELNRIRRKRYYWSNNSNGLNRRFFIGEVRILGSRKDLLLTSSVVFRNNLNKKLFILLKSPRFKGLQMEVPGLGKRGCPGEYGEEMGSFVMKVLDEEEYYTKSVYNNAHVFSSQFDFHSLRVQCEGKDSYVYEVSHSPTFSLLKIEKDPILHEKLIISIHPCFKFTNALPLPLEIKLFSLEMPFFSKENLAESKDFVNLSPQFEYHELNFNLKGKLMMLLKLPGFETSRKIIIHDPNNQDLYIEPKAINLTNSSSELIPDEDCSSQIFIIVKTNNLQKEIFLYAKACIINQTYHLLDFYGYNKKTGHRNKINRGNIQQKKPFGYSIGQVVLLGRQKHLMVGFKGLTQQTSNEIEVEGVESGSFNLEIKSINEEKYELFEFVVNVSMKKAGSLNLLTKTIEITHKYVILNKTSIPLEIAQYSTSSSPIIIKPNERSPFHWADCTKDKSITIRIFSSDPESQWFWSGPIDINISRSLSFVLNRKGPNPFSNPENNLQDADSLDCLFIKLDIVKVKGGFFLSFLIMNSDNYSYMLRNDTTNYLIKYRQVGYGNNEIDLMNEELILSKETSKPFASVYPNLKPEIQVQFLHHTEILTPQTFIFNLDTIIETRELTLTKTLPSDCPLNIKVNTFIHGPTKVLRFYEKEYQSDSPPIFNSKHKGLNSVLKTKQREENEEVGEEEAKETLELMILMNISEVGVSLIARNAQKDLVEMNYIIIRGLEFLLIEEKRFKTFQLRTKFVNIDNNSDYGTLIPVIFTPSQPRSLKQKQRFFLDICVKYNHNSREVLCFNSIRLNILSATIKLDEDYISLFLQWIETINNILIGLDEDGETLRKKPLGSTDLLFLPQGELSNHALNMKLFHNNVELKLPILVSSCNEIFELFDLNNKSPYSEWEWVEIPESNRYIYIKELVLPPIDFFLSFSRRIRTSKSDSNFKMLTNALSKAFMNIDEAPIHLQGFKLNYIFDTKSGIIEKLIDHYKTSIISTVLKVIGSINIIGNPIGLYNYIKSGFGELIDRPRQGLVQGPLEAGLGALIGAGCLIKQTFAGTFNSLHHITGSFATGFTILSFDDSFIEKRRKFKLKKPHNVIEGIDQGFRSIYSGLEEGVTGLVVKPFQGARKEGFPGLVKGTITGLSGLILKPMTGICDATSKTAEGLKNTTVHFDDKPNEERIRFPRVFYEKEKYIKKYDSVDAEVMQILQEVKKGKLKDLTFVEAFIIYLKKNACFLIITMEEFLCYSLVRKSFYWKLKVGNVDKVERFKDERNENLMVVRISLKKVDLKENLKIIEFKIDDKNDRGRKSNEELYECLVKVIENYKQDEWDFLI